MLCFVSEPPAPDLPSLSLPLIVHRDHLQFECARSGRQPELTKEQADHQMTKEAVKVVQEDVRSLRQRLVFIDARIVLDSVLLDYRPDTTSAGNKAEALGDEELDMVWSELGLNDGVVA